jgi:hypothetical protein
LRNNASVFILFCEMQKSRFRRQLNLSLASQRIKLSFSVYYPIDAPFGAPQEEVEMKEKKSSLAATQTSNCGR